MLGLSHLTLLDCPKKVGELGKVICKQSWTVYNISRDIEILGYVLSTPASYSHTIR